MDDDFVDDKGTLHIEVGAGRGIFGRTHYPACFLTDINAELVTRWQVATLDRLCSVYSLPWGSDRFNRIIMCNPYGYGFSTRDEADLLLLECCRVLSPRGELIVVGHTRNKYCNPVRVERRLNDFSSRTGIMFNFKSVGINPDNEYPGYVFERMDFTRTYPNFRLEIEVQK